MAGPVPASAHQKPPEPPHLMEYWHVVLVRRRLVAAVALSILAVAVLRVVLVRPVYEAVTQVLVERENLNIVNFKEVSQVDALRDDYYQTQFKILQSRTLARQVIESMDLLARPELDGPRTPAEIEAIEKAPAGTSAAMEKAIDVFSENVSVQLVKNSRIFSIGYSSGDPEHAAAVANRLAQLYIEQTLDFRFRTSSEAGEWLGSQIDDQRQKVEAARRAIERLKEKEGIVNIEERRALVDQKLKELGTALTGLKTTRLEKEALYREMKSAPYPEELPEVMRNPLIQSLRIELASLERQMAQLQQRYLDQHPEVIKVRNQIQETRGRISSEAARVIRAAENDYKSAFAQESSVAAALEAAKAETLDLSRRGVQYDTLKRDLDASNQVLNSLLSRSKETDVTRELKSANIRIVDPAAVPRKPVRPRPLRDIVLGLVAGVVCGLGLAFFLDYLDNTVKTPEDVRTRLGLPLLTVIPESKDALPDERSSLVVLTAQDSPFGEGYRLLRTALNYSWPEQKNKVVVVTSTVPGEGKTITSVNLALILSALNAKVLLVDADLRKPQCHTTLRAQRGPGLTDVLVGATPISAAIQRPAGTSLSLLGAGSHSPSPADLLSGTVVRNVVEGVRQFYDWIIVDTPPVAAVSDTLVLAPLSDGVVLVIGAEMVPRAAVTHTVQRVTEAGARVVGAVLNRAQVDRHASYYAYSSHYYGHYYGHYGPQKAAAGAGPTKVAPITRRGARRG